MKLQDKVALITGGAQGLGKSIALAMAREGANIVICDINPDTLPTAATEIEALGRACLGVRCDVSSSASVREMFAQIADRFGTLHILVNNAALLQKGEANEAARSRFYEMVTTPIPKRSLGVTKDFTDEEWHKYWGVNVHGVFYCTREALKLMEPQKAGKIINIASVAGIGGFSAFHPSYCATKGAVLAFTRSVAVEVAGANVFVNAIAAGGILTPPMEAYLSKCSEEERNRVHQLVPLGRLGKPEEYASLAVYLASDEHYLVGQTISPNGGIEHAYDSPRSRSSPETQLFKECPWNRRPRGRSCVRQCESLDLRLSQVLRSQRGDGAYLWSEAYSQLRENAVAEVHHDDSDHVLFEAMGRGARTRLSAAADAIPGYNSPASSRLFKKC